MAEINRRTGRPVTFGVAQSNAGPELYKVILDLVDEEAAARRRAAAADDRARHRPAVRAAAPHVLRPRPVVGRRSQTLDLAERLAVLDDDDAARRADRATPRQNLPPFDWSGVYVLTAGPGRLLRRSRRLARRRTPQRAGETIPAAFVRISRETRGPRAVQLPVPEPAHGRGRGDARTPAHARRPRRLRRARRADHGRVAARPGSSRTGSATARSSRSRRASAASRPTPPTCSASPTGACSRPARTPT